MTIDDVNNKKIENNIISWLKKVQINDPAKQFIVLVVNFTDDINNE